MEVCNEIVECFWIQISLSCLRSEKKNDELYICCFKWECIYTNENFGGGNFLATALSKRKWADDPDMI